MFYKILILISFSIYAILPIKVFGLEQQNFFLKEITMIFLQKFSKELMEIF